MKQMNQVKQMKLKMKGSEISRWTRSVLLTAMIGLSGTLANAYHRVGWGTPSYGGTGCPAGTAHIEVDEMGNSFSVHLYEFVAAAGGGRGRTLDRKACGVVVPVQVPAGLSVSLVPMESLTGYAHLSEGSSAQINVEHFFAGGRGPRFHRQLQGEFSGLFTLPMEFYRVTDWSPCGQDVNIRINLSAIARTADGDGEAYVALENPTDGNQYQLRWRSCLRN